MATQGLQPVDSATVNSYAQDLRQLLKEADLIERKSFLRSLYKENRGGQRAGFNILHIAPASR